MIAVATVVHVILAITMIILVLLQRSDGGALGGLGGGSFGGVMSGRQSANLLTRGTGILAACFMGTSMLLAILASGGEDRGSILDQAPAAATESPAPAPAESDTSPSVPVAQ